MTTAKQITAQVTANNQTIATIRQQLSSVQEQSRRFHAGEITWDQYYNTLFSIGDRSELEHRIDFLQRWNEALTGETKYMSEHLYSDIYAYEIVDIKTPKRFVLRRMVATEKKEAHEQRMESFQPGGFCGHFDNELQEWDIQPDPKGYTIEVSVRLMHGHYRIFMVGKGCTPFTFEREPRYHFDFNF